MVDEKPILPLSGFLFPRIFQAFRMAIEPSKLAIAFIAVTLICLTGWTMDLTRTVVKGTYATASPSGSTRQDRDATELDIYRIPNASLQNFVESRRTGARTGVFTTLWHAGAGDFHTALYAILSLNLSAVPRSMTDGGKALLWAFQWHPLYSIVFFTVVLSAAGGAICRMAALQFAGAERPSGEQAVRFARRKLISLLAGPLGPMILVLLFGVPIMLVGLAGNLPIIGELLTGLFLLLALIAACAATITLIGTMGGLGLMSPAIAYEDSDGFDAINHAFSYVYTKPWRLGFYTIVAVVYGAVCYVFVRFFAFLLLWTTYRFLEIGFLGQNEKLHALWPEPTFTDFVGPAGTTPDTWYGWLAALLIRLWVLGIIGLLVSFVISFYFSANTIIYALMRYSVDGTPVEEVHISSREVSPAFPSFEPGSGTTATQPSMTLNGGIQQGLKMTE
jgi:hypothetical protein